MGFSAGGKLRLRGLRLAWEKFRGTARGYCFRKNSLISASLSVFNRSTPASNSSFQPFGLFARPELQPALVRACGGPVRSTHPLLFRQWTIPPPLNCFVQLSLISGNERDGRIPTKSASRPSRAGSEFFGAHRGLGALPEMIGMTAFV